MMTNEWVILRDTIVIEKCFDYDKTEEALRHLSYLKSTYPGYNFQMSLMGDKKFGQCIKSLSAITHIDVRGRL